MSGDFESWDNRPAKHEAPKEPSPEFQEWRRSEIVRVLLWILAFAGLGLAAWLWRGGWRPF